MAVRVKLKWTSHSVTASDHVYGHIITSAWQATDKKWPVSVLKIVKKGADFSSISGFHPLNSAPLRQNG
jgi:hypothetical protein